MRHRVGNFDGSLGRAGSVVLAAGTGRFGGSRQGRESRGWGRGRAGAGGEGLVLEWVPVSYLESKLQGREPTSRGTDAGIWIGAFREQPILM